MVIHVHLSGPDQTKKKLIGLQKGKKLVLSRAARKRAPYFAHFSQFFYVHGGVELANPCVGDMCKHL
jgi:hypothetical protein